MTAPATQVPANPAAAARETLGQKATRWIEDPFASVIAGIVIPAFAVAFLLSAMSGLALVV